MAHCFYYFWQGCAILAQYHALHAAPARVTLLGTGAANAATISRWLLLNRCGRCDSWYCRQCRPCPLSKMRECLDGAVRRLEGNGHCRQCSFFRRMLPWRSPMHKCVQMCTAARSPLGRGRTSFLRWLVDAGRAGNADAGAMPVSTAERSKAVKALGGAIEADERVLGHVDVQAAVRGRCLLANAAHCHWGIGYLLLLAALTAMLLHSAGVLGPG